MEDELVYFASFSIMTLILIQISFQTQERMRLMFMVAREGFNEQKSIGRRFKLFILFDLLSIQFMMAVSIIVSVVFLINQSASIIELLNNSLSALVLDQLDNMGSIALFSWVRQRYNYMTRTSEFMIVKSNPVIENITVIGLIWPISQFASAFSQLDDIEGIISQ